MPRVTQQSAVTLARLRNKVFLLYRMQVQFAVNRIVIEIPTQEMTLMKKPICIFIMTILFAACSTTSSTSTHLERKHYHELEQPLGFAQVVRKGNTLYVSGIGSAGTTMVEQVDGVYRAVQKILDDYKASPSDVAKEVIYTTDIEAFKNANTVRKQFYVDGQYPSSSWVQVVRLFYPEMQVEVEFVVELLR